MILRWNKNCKQIDNMWYSIELYSIVYIIQTIWLNRLIPYMCTYSFIISCFHYDLLDLLCRIRFYFSKLIQIPFFQLIIIFNFSIKILLIQSNSIRPFRSNELKVCEYTIKCNPYRNRTLELQKLNNKILLKCWYDII
jgi:hypothetical protein